MKRLFATMLVASLGGCDGGDVHKIVTYPSVTITTPDDGDVLVEGVSVLMEGLIQDSTFASELETLTAQWSVAGVAVCSEATVTSDGDTLCAHSFDAGEDVVVVLQATNPTGGTAEYSVTVDVQANEPPQVELLSPEEGGRYYSDQLIVFAAEVSDDNDRSEELTLEWTSSQEGSLTSLNGSPSSSGVQTGALILSEGEHFIQVVASDLAGRTADDTVTIDVGPPNSEPTCGIDLPVSNAIAGFGKSVVFQGTADDVDVASPEDLMVAWGSDIDGVFSTVSPSSSGEVLITYDALSLGTHVITLEVTDDVGATCSDSILLTIGSGPVLTLTSPTSGDVINESDSVIIEGTVSDVEDLPTQIGMSWSSSLDGVFSTQGADSSGNISFAAATLSNGTHTLTATATDLDGLSAVATVTFVVNGLPSQPVVEIDPDPATSSDGLAANLTTGSTDPEGDTITYAYEWYLDGGLTAYTGTTVPSTATTRGDVWRVVVTPSDLYGSGSSGTDSVTIENTLPELASVSLTPDPATVSSTMSCAPGVATDADGDTVSYSYGWIVDGVALSVTTSTLSGTYFSKGETVVCTVTPNDLYGDGTTVNSNTVTISNTLPVLSGATLTPTSAYEDSTLTCTPGTASDLDGDTVSFSYAWYVNAILISPTSSTLTGTDFAKSDDVYCLVTPNDGTADGASVRSSTIVIENSVPGVASASLTPTTADESSTLSCTGGATSDADGDTVTLGYSWTVNGATIAATSSTLTGTYFDKADEVRCVITPNDGMEDGDSETSNAVTIENTVPELDLVDLTPDPAYETDVLNCTPGTTTDPDSDTISYSYEWYVDSVVLTVSTSTLSGTYFDRGHVVMCLVTPDDGEEEGATVTSNAVTIENSIPELLSVSLSPTTAYETSTLSCTPGTSSDDDGDTVGYIYDWIVGGTSVGLGTSSLTGAYFDKGDSVYCNATPDDGLDTGTTIASNVVTIANSLPTVDSASVTPTTAYEITTLSCVGGTTDDDDGDTVTVSYKWQVNTATLGVSSSTLDGSYFDHGDEVNCLVIPDDGSDEGVSVKSNVVTILNSLPSINTATISPGIPFTDDSLIVTVSGASDDDGETVTYSYQWYVEGVAVTSGGTGAALSSSKTTKGDVVYVVVTPKDGTDDGVSVTSATTTISNTPPGAPAVDLTPDDAEPADDLDCDITADSYDEDGDSITYTYAWTRNGTVTSYTTASLSYTNTSDGDTWACYATPDDGDDLGPAGYDLVSVVDRTAPDRPIIVAIERYRNEDSFDVSGSAEPYSTVSLYYSCDDGTNGSYSTTANSSGGWSITATQTAGLDCDYYAVATDMTGNVSDASNVVATEVCDPGDDYEDLNQNTCGDPVSEWSTLDSDGTVTVTVDGNIVDGSDTDWYHLDVSQTLTSASGYSINPYNLEIDLSAGASDYDFLIYRGGCASSDVECSTSGYDSYDFYAYDSGESYHTPPTNRAACRSSSIYFNQCSDFSDDMYIKVIRTSAFDCSGYTLTITNGK